MTLKNKLEEVANEADALCHSPQDLTIEVMNVIADWLDENAEALSGSDGSESIQYLARQLRNEANQ